MSKLSGVFVDSVVQGLHYETASQSGFTDELGTFFYEEGEEVHFFIGGISVGATAAGPIITPLDLFADAEDYTDRRVKNVVRLLLTLDTDGDATNGVTLPEDTDIPEAEIVFDQSVAAFAGDAAVLQVLASATNVSELLDDALASEHFRGTLVDLGYDIKAPEVDPTPTPTLTPIPTPTLTPTPYPTPTPTLPPRPTPTPTFTPSPAWDVWFTVNVTGLVGSDTIVISIDGDTPFQIGLGGTGRYESGISGATRPSPYVISIVDSGSYTCTLTSDSNNWINDIVCVL